jgi:acetylornithine deacetylase/succinyl-diaminopimelate desuccinylase-like protein
MLGADFIVLSDTANFDTGIPALTYQLRGICQLDVEVQCLERPVHSGMWGGPVPDPVQILCKIIAGLTDEKGALNIPGLYKMVAKPGKKQEQRIRALPFNEKKFKKDAGMMRGMTLAGEKGYSVYEKIWTRPSLTVIAFEARQFQGSSNQIIDAARARLSLRTVPNVDGKKAAALLKKKLMSKVPYGAKVTVTGSRSNVTPWWTTDPEGPAFERAARSKRVRQGER